VQLPSGEVVNLCETANVFVNKYFRPIHIYFSQKPKQMCREKRCSAPDGFGGRCKNVTEDPNCDQCKLHHQVAKDLCIKYKEICQVANAKNVDVKIKDPEEHVKYLLNVHKWCERAYDARWEHQLYAYAELDSGHYIQFTMIQDKMDACYQKITELHNRKRVEVLAETPLGLSEDLLDDADPPPTTQASVSQKALEKMEKFKQRQKADEIKLDNVLRRNRAENERLEQRQNKLGVKCLERLRALIPRQYHDNLFFEASALSVVGELHNQGYYHPDYLPNPCPNCDCGGFKESVFKLGCVCFTRTDITSLTFVAGFGIKFLTAITEDLVKSSEKIVPALEDLARAYEKHGKIMVRKLMMLVWEPSQDRLVLSYETANRPLKHSEVLRNQRQRQVVKMQSGSNSQNDLRVRNGMTKLDEPKPFLDTVYNLSKYIDTNGKLPSANAKRPEVVSLDEWIHEQFENFGPDESDSKGELVIPENYAAFLKLVRKYYRYFFPDEPKLLE
jgi:hypothetical protein